MNVNQLAARLTGRNLPLSHYNLKSLEEITTRARLLEMSVNDRGRELDQIINEHGAGEQNFLTEAVEQPWERAVTSNKLPCYINRATESVHYLSPKYTEIINSLVHFNFVRYCAYRTAMKLKALQSAFGLDHVTVQMLASAFENHGLGPNAKARTSIASSEENAEAAKSSPRTEEKSDATAPKTARKSMPRNDEKDGHATKTTKAAKSFDMNINAETGDLIPYELRHMGVSEIISCLNHIFEAVNVGLGNNGSDITSGVGSNSSAASSQPGTSSQRGKQANLDSPDTNGSNAQSTINVPLSVDLVLNFMLSLFDG